MKKFIITERQLRIIEKYIPFKHQEKVDSALDKINKSGIESLTDEEIFFLKNPDAEIENVELDMEGFESESDGMMMMLVYLNLLGRNDYQQIDEMLYEVDDVPNDLGVPFGYFQDGRVLHITCKPEDMEILIEFDPEADSELVDELKSYIETNWVPAEEFVEIHFL